MHTDKRERGKTREDKQVDTRGPLVHVLFAFFIKMGPGDICPPMVLLTWQHRFGGCFKGETPLSSVSSKTVQMGVKVRVSTNHTLYNSEKLPNFLKLIGKVKLTFS